MGADVTRLLTDWSQGNQEALEQLAPIVYDELRRLAARYLRRERPGPTLQSTALVHEAYLRLVDQNLVQWQNRAHFFGVAARMIRRILVDHARGYQVSRRGSGTARLALDKALDAAAPGELNLVDLDDALETLGRLDPAQARVIEIRYFAGLSIEETSVALGISPATVRREWASAEAWLYRELNRKTRTARSESMPRSAGSR